MKKWVDFSDMPVLQGVLFATSYIILGIVVLIVCLSMIFSIIDFVQTKCREIEVTYDSVHRIESELARLTRITYKLHNNSFDRGDGTSITAPEEGSFLISNLPDPQGGYTGKILVTGLALQADVTDCQMSNFKTEYSNVLTIKD